VEDSPDRYRRGHGPRGARRCGRRRGLLEPEGGLARLRGGEGEDRYPPREVLRSRGGIGQARGGGAPHGGRPRGARREGLGGGDLYPEAALAAPEEQASRIKGAANELEEELSSFSGRLKACEADLASFRETHREALARREKEKRELEERTRAFDKLLAALPKIAADCGLIDAKAELVEARSASELIAEVSTYDPETVANQGEDALPAEECLQRIPALVTRLFGACPELAKLRVRFESRQISETGIEARRLMEQRFTMDRKRWSELVSGIWKDDWQTLLSKSLPPRSTPGGRLPARRMAVHGPRDALRHRARGDLRRPHAHDGVTGLHLHGHPPAIGRPARSLRGSRGPGDRSGRPAPAATASSRRSGR